MSPVPTLAATPLGGRGPLLLVGPAIGTSAATLWARCAARAGRGLRRAGLDLPGMARSAPATEPFSIAELAQGVLTLAGDRPFHYAGDSIGGAVGLQLLLDHRVAGAALLCTGARIGTPDSWHERAALVRTEGTKAIVPTAAQTWFAPWVRRPGAGRRRGTARPPGRHRRRFVRVGLRGARRLRRDRPAG